MCFFWTKSHRHVAALVASIGWFSIAAATSPQSVRQGRLLFEKEWTAGNPAFGSDGLGPLFNAKSCVACHHQGGVGGSGDSRFNAQSIGVDAIRVTGRSSQNAVNDLVRVLHPDLINRSGAMVTTARLPHFGGSPTMESLRDRYRRYSTSEFAEEGGAMTPADVRENMTAAWHWSGVSGQTAVAIEARIYQRNTTAMFGAGLIDQVTDKFLERQEKAQKRHPEISGRISVLRDMTYGRFGWRGNVSRLVGFVDQACANEMGLETSSQSQPGDIAIPDYRNPGIDIRDEQVQQMTDFLAALPRPIRAQPRDASHARQIASGETVFDQVGCNVCHVKDMGVATDVFSDLLLHDMGDRLYDYDAAEPYVRSSRVVEEFVPIGPSTLSTGYYGSSVTLDPTRPNSVVPAYRGYQRTPRGNTSRFDSVVIERGEEFIQNQQVGTRLSRRTPMRHQLAHRRTLEPSNITQEWRTPPLWGVADSAPYMHDGRAETLMEAIAMHGGESAATRERFLSRSFVEREAVIAFLQSLIAPPTAPQAETLAQAR